MPLDIQHPAIKIAKPAVVFPAAGWKHILKLLGLMIVADGKTYEEEIEAFLKAVKELRAIIDPTVCLTEQMAYDWFKRNKPDLEAIIDSLSYDSALCEILAPIKSMPHKLDVVSHMVKIAVSDGKYCDVEKGLIAKTCLYWNLRGNFQSNLEVLFRPDDDPKLIDFLKGHPRYAHVNKTY